MIRNWSQTPLMKVVERGIFVKHVKQAILGRKRALVNGRGRTKRPLEGRI